MSTTFTPLGIRFWDGARNAQIRRGLRVTARPAENSGPATIAFRTASDIYAFRGLAGLRHLEYPDEPLPTEFPQDDLTRFIVEVEDRERRFLTAVFQIALPLPQRGIFPAYLFSAPTRAPLPGEATVRGQLIQAEDETPAAHARLELRAFPTQDPITAIADSQGRFLILFPYPGLHHAAPDSGDPLPQRRWTLTVQIFYQPDTLTYLRETAVPDLRTIFEQEQGAIWTQQPGPPQPQAEFTLFYGQPLVLRTEGLSTLRISPAP